MAGEDAEGAVRVGPPELGMATTKITVSFPDDPLEAVRALVAHGGATAVSAFVKHAVGVALSDAAEWREMWRDALQQTGAPADEGGTHMGGRNPEAAIP